MEAKVHSDSAVQRENVERARGVKECGGFNRTGKLCAYYEIGIRQLWTGVFS